MCAHHASPKFIAPRAKGLTLTAAEGDSTRYLPRRDLGSGLGSIVEAIGRYLDELMYVPVGGWKGISLLLGMFEGIGVGCSC